MKSFLLLSFLATSVAWSNPRCVADWNCGVYDETTTCYLTQTGTDHLGQTTCKVQCYRGWAGPVCVKKDYRPYGRCVSFKLPEEYQHQPDGSCKLAVSLELLERVVR